MSKYSKAELVAQLITVLRQEIEVLTLSVQNATEGATHAEARPENQYDTRGLEASYLAGAQAERLALLKADTDRLRALPTGPTGEGAAIALGSLVELAEIDDETGEPGTRSTWLIVPAGGGYGLRRSDGGLATTVTPQAPLGRELVGRVAGDLLTMTTPQGEKEYEIIAVW